MRAVPAVGTYNFCHVLDNPCPEPPQKPSSPGPVGRLTPLEEKCYGIIFVYTVTITDWYNKKLKSQLLGRIFWAERMLGKQRQRSQPDRE